MKRLPLVTLIIAAINILLFLIFGNSWADNVGDTNATSWYSLLNVTRLLRNLLNSFEHSNLQHTLLNMLCFVVTGGYIEYQLGVKRSLCVFSFMIMLSSLAIAANYLSLEWCGFSGVNYSLYAFVIVSFLTSIKSKPLKRQLGGFVMLALIYLAMCWNGGSNSLGFSAYPYDLIHNLAHYSSFVVGLLFSACLCAFSEEKCA